MNGAVSGMLFGFRSLLCSIVCIQSDWARPKICFLREDVVPSVLRHQTNILCLLLNIGSARLIRFQRSLKFIYIPQENSLLSMAKVHVPHYKIGMYVRSSAHFLEMTIQNE